MGRPTNNNRTPKNSSSALLSGKNNTLDGNANEFIILGDGNIVGDSINVALIGSSGCIVGNGCENITMINSSGCIVSPGLTNVYLTNTYNQTIEESNIIFQNNAQQLPPQPANTLTNVYETTVDVTSAELLNLFSSPKELIPSPGAGYFTQVISAAWKSGVGSNVYTSNPIGIITDTSASYQWTWSIAQTADNSKFQPTYFGEGYSFVSDKAIYLKTTSSNPTGGDFDIRIYLTYVIRQE